MDERQTMHAMMLDDAYCVERVLPLAFGVLGVEMAQSVSDVLTFAVTIPFMRRILRELS